MQLIANHVRRAGGVLHKSDLVALGATDRTLTTAVRRGHVHRARRGWYTTFPPGDARHEAVRIGGRLTGASLLASFGAWTWSEPVVSVVVPPGASRLRPRDGTVVRWRDDGRVPPRPLAGPPRARPGDDEHAVEDAMRSAWAVPLRTALVDAVVAVPLDEAVALLDWALATGLFSLVGLHEAFARAPSDVRGIVEWADPRCESFIESIMRTTFTSRGHVVETQVAVGPGDRRRIDLVVDGVTALEVDGRRWHHDTFDADRLKDLAITIQGRVSLRVSYAMVRDHCPLIVEAVESVLARSGRRRSRGEGLHLSRAEGVHRQGLRPRVVTARGSRPWHLARGPVARGARGHSRGQTGDSSSHRAVGATVVSTPGQLPKRPSTTTTPAMPVPVPVPGAP
jgi:hypothetical protein